MLKKGHNFFEKFGKEEKMIIKKTWIAKVQTIMRKINQMCNTCAQVIF